MERQTLRQYRWSDGYSAAVPFEATYGMFAKRSLAALRQARDVTIEGRAFVPPLQLHVYAAKKWLSVGMVGCCNTTVQDRPELAGPGQPGRLRSATLAKCVLRDRRDVNRYWRGWYAMADKQSARSWKLEQFLSGVIPHLVDVAFGTMPGDGT